MMCRVLSARSFRSQVGISLLEVLAALVILSMGASVAFTWFAQSAAVMTRVKAEEVGLLARNEAMEYIRAINPVAQPEGQVEMPGYQLTWHSRSIGEPMPALTTLGTASRYEVSLYEVDIALARDTATPNPWIRFTLNLAGYRQVGSGSTGFLEMTAPGGVP